MKKLSQDVKLFAFIIKLKGIRQFDNKCLYHMLFIIPHVITNVSFEDVNNPNKLSLLGVSNLDCLYVVSAIPNHKTSYFTF